MNMFWYISFILSLTLYGFFSYIIMILLLMEYGYDDFLNTFSFGNETIMQWIINLSPIFLPICLIHQIYKFIKEILWNQ